MKYGKIYDYRNKEEAKKLIGKKVLTSDIFYDLGEETAEATARKDYIGTLILVKETCRYPFSVEFSNGNSFSYQFIREVIEEEPTLMTNRQLSEWLARGFGEIQLAGGESKNRICHTFNEYYVMNENKPVFEMYRIRSWDSDEWVVPTVDIYERDCKSYCRTTLA